jgi:uncharacterized protein
MSMIRETVVSTVNQNGEAHLAPLGIIAQGDGWIIAPFHPSTTLNNLRSVPFAVANFTDDVRVFAGCLTGRRQWQTVSCDEFPVPRIADTLAHAELVVTHISEDEQRPRFHCRVQRNVTHAPFKGFNRAQAAVIEAAILVSRLNMLPRDKVEREISYLEIAISKTASLIEAEAWSWLMEAVQDFYTTADRTDRTHERQR